MLLDVCHDCKAFLNGLPDCTKLNVIYSFSTRYSSKIVALYGIGAYGTVTYGGQSNPLLRQPVEGSGFAIALRVVDNGESSPYSLKGFQLEFDAGARR